MLLAIAMFESGMFLAPYESGLIIHKNSEDYYFGVQEKMNFMNFKWILISPMVITDGFMKLNVGVGVKQIRSFFGKSLKIPFWDKTFLLRNLYINVGGIRYRNAYKSVYGATIGGTGEAGIMLSEDFEVSWRLSVSPTITIDCTSWLSECFKHVNQLNKDLYYRTRIGLKWNKWKQFFLAGELYGAFRKFAFGGIYFGIDGITFSFLPFLDSLRDGKIVNITSIHYTEKYKRDERQDYNHPKDTQGAQNMAADTLKIKIYDSPLALGGSGVFIDSLELPLDTINDLYLDLSPCPRPALCNFFSAPFYLKDSAVLTPLPFRKKDKNKMEITLIRDWLIYCIFKDSSDTSFSMKYRSVRYEDSVAWFAFGSLNEDKIFIRFAYQTNKDKKDSTNLVIELKSLNSEPKTINIDLRKTFKDNCRQIHSHILSIIGKFSDQNPSHNREPKK